MRSIDLAWGQSIDRVSTELMQTIDNRNCTMLVLQNIKGSAHNPILDNYLVIKVIDYSDIAFNELQSLVELVVSIPERV